MRNELFYSYMSDFDKVFAFIETTADIEMAKLNLAYDHANKMEQIRYMQSDLKVLTESGSYDDMMLLYEASAQEGNEQKKNVISRMVDAILKFIQDVFDALRRLFGGEKVKQFEVAVSKGEIKGNVNIEKNPTTLFTKAADVFAKITDFLKPGFRVTKEDGEKKFSIIKTLVTSIEAIGVVAIGVTQIPKLYEKCQNMIKKGEGLVKDSEKKIQEKIDKGEGDDQVVEHGKGLIELARRTIKSLVECAKDIGSKMAKLLPGKKGKEGDAEGTEGEDTDSGESESEPEEKPEAKDDKSEGKVEKESTHDFYNYDIDDALMQESFMDDGMDELSDLYDLL